MIPVRAFGPELSRSETTPMIPGTIFASLASELQILEALVHEAAHHHFLFVEAFGPVVEPTDSNTYSSPLRTEMRPLRGVFAALHAIVYMLAFYVGILQTPLRLVQGLDFRISELRQQMADAASTVGSNRRSLTTAGRDLLAKTMSVAAFADP
jgi:HEXXH motif-containing protein